MSQLLIAFGFLFLLLPCAGLGAADLSPGEKSPPAEKEKAYRVGGELKLIGSASWPPGESVLNPTPGTETFYDGLFEGRLKGQLFLTDWLNFEGHYVLGVEGGDTRKAAGRSPFSAFFGGGDVVGPTSDKRQLFDLSWNIVEKDEYVVYNRIDRLAVTAGKNWGLIRLGRQAFTWGNGLLFNPMDFVNPFSPTDVVREYKVGQDMAFAQIAGPSWGNLQLAYVPRRNPDTDAVEWDESTVAGKFRFAVGKTQFDLLAAADLGDPIVGAGVTGYLGRAAWRLDATWTFLQGNGNGAPTLPGTGIGGTTDDRNGYLSLVANIDTSWTWGGRNWYGFLEFFYSGIGHTSDYSSALNDPDLRKRLDRNELFTLGQYYVAGHIRCEVHPLVNIFLTVISNVHDPSGVVQPRLTWDISRAFKLTVWGNVFLGREGTEYGGFPVQGTNLNRTFSDAVLAWLSFYF
jgi:hypothetical protein